MARGALDLPVAVVLNKSGTDDASIEDYCHDEGLPILLRLPLQRKIAVAFHWGAHWWRPCPPIGRISRHCCARRGIWQEDAMKQLAILSGKGGTGKTMVAAGLATMAARAGRVVLVDADVDAANLELILRPDILQAADFSGGKRAVIDAHACTACGRCASACRFEAVEQQGGAYRVDAMACEGCAACAYQCPTGAIQMQDSPSGQWFRSETRVGPLVHARLQPGEQNSGKLVSRIRQEAVAWGTECRADWVLIDGSPGIGCPVIAAATGGPSVVGGRADRLRAA